MGSVPEGRSFMEQETNIKYTEAMSPWKDREALPTPARGSVALSAAIFLLACFAIPFSVLNESAAILLWAALCAAGFFFTRSARGLTGLTVGASFLGAILPAALLPLGLTYYPAVGAIIAAACVGVCAGAYYQTVTRRYWVLPVLALAASVGAYLATNEVLFAAMAFAILPAAILLAVATYLGEGATSAICFATGGLLVGVVGLIALWIGGSFGAPTPELLRGLLSEWKEGFVQAQIASRGELIALIDQQIASAGAGDNVSSMEALKASFESMMSDGMIRSSMDVMFNLIPAVLFLCCAIPAYLGQRLLNAAYNTNGMRAVVTLEAETFTVSLSAAILYVASLALSLLPTSGDGFLTMVASNLSFILMPALLIIGIRAFKQMIRTRGKSSRRVTWIVLIVFLLMASTGALYLGAFFGAYVRIMQAIGKGIQNKINRGNGSGTL